MSLESEALLKERLKIGFVNGRPMVEPVVGKLTLGQGYFLTVRAIQEMKKSNQMIVVGIGGASGSGKTHLSDALKKPFANTIVIGLDDYLKRDLVREDNFDHPDLLDFELLEKNLQDLIDNKPTEAPIYSFEHSKRIGFRTLNPPQDKLVIVEGTYALKPVLRKMYNLSVSVTGGVHFDLVKRVIRDMSRVGQKANEVLSQITDTVYPMYKAFIEPDLLLAQFRIVNHFNPFQELMNPHFVLKSYTVPEISEIKSALSAIGEVEEKSESYSDVFLYPPGISPEKCNSWLRFRDFGTHYQLMFAEWIIEDPFLISPRLQFEVNVRVLGGLLSLGYKLGFALKRTSQVFTAGGATISVDKVEHVEENFISIKGTDKNVVLRLGSQLDLDGKYEPKPFLELIRATSRLEDVNNRQVISQLNENWHLDLPSSDPGNSPSKKSESADASVDDENQDLGLDEDAPWHPAAARAVSAGKVRNLEQQRVHLESELKRERSENSALREQLKAMSKQQDDMNQKLDKALQLLEKLASK